MRIESATVTTMAEVAKHAGVSITTVSHVVNGTRRVNAETTARVQEAIDRTGYRPNSIARALTGARTKSIGLAISGISNPYFMDVISAIEAEAARFGHTLLLADTHDEPEKELQMVRELVRRRVDGLLLAPSPGARDHALEYVFAESFPVVLVDRTLDVGIDQISSENHEATRHLVEHLLDLGHRRIGFVAGLRGLSTSEERIDGYFDALARAGLPAAGELLADGGSQHASARAAVHRLLDVNDPPTALVAANNAMTIGALHALRDRGLAVPHDLALVAYDDFEWSPLFEPRLTVVAQETREIGAGAVRLLISRLAQPDLAPRSVRVDSHFVHRDSCGCPVPDRH